MASDAAAENYEFQKIVVSIGITLFILKFIAYFITGSAAVFTDAVESTVNVVAGIVCLYALYLSMKPVDLTHPRGYGKAETLSASAEGIMISVAGVLILIEAISEIRNPTPISNLDIGIVLLLVAALVNYAMGRAAIGKGRGNSSLALEATGRHLCTDTYSSIGLIGGLIVIMAASQLGHNIDWLDPALALVYGALILITGLRVVNKSLKDIMDTIDLETVNDVVNVLSENRTDDWIDIHSLKVSRRGNSIEVEMHITLPFNMTVKEAERQENILHDALSSRFQGNEVVMYIMPEQCRPYSCHQCSKGTCVERRHEFKRRIEWNPELLTQDSQHGTGFVALSDRGTKRN